MNEIQTNFTSGAELYFQVRNSNALIWNTSTLAFETPLDSNWFNYSILMTEQQASGFYVGSFPTAITAAGTYSVSIYTGNEYFANGYYVTGGNIVWNGTSTNTPPVGLAWLSLSDYKTMLNITTTATDSQISMLLPMVSMACNNWLGYNPQNQSYTNLYNGNGTEYLRLGTKNVTYVSQVIFDYYGDNPNTVAGTEFVVDSAGTLRFVTDSEYRQPFVSEFIQATFTAGWNPLPQDLLICCGLATQATLMMLDGDTLVTSKKIKDAQTNWTSIYSKFLDIKDPTFATCRTILQKYKDIFCY